MAAPTNRKNMKPSKKFKKKKNDQCDKVQGNSSLIAKEPTQHTRKSNMKTYKADLKKTQIPARIKDRESSVDKVLAKVSKGKKKHAKVCEFSVAKQKTMNDIDIILPKTPSEISSNWEQLKKMLQIEKAGKKRPSGSNSKSEGLSFSKYKKQKLEKKEENSQSEDIWFDDVDDTLLSKGVPETKSKLPQRNPLVKLGAFEGITKAVAMDCEMVGIGPDGRGDMLARVSIVNQTGHCIYNEYVLPREKVTDYRTRVSGIRRGDLDKGKDFKVVCKEVADIIKGKILVGHAIHNDLQVLYLSHPHKAIRDTSKYRLFRQMFDGRTPSLKKLTAKVLNVSVQEGEHDSVQDAQAAMRLYTMHKKKWEQEIKLGKKRPKSKGRNPDLDSKDN